MVLSVAANVATDAANNQNTASTTQTVTVFVVQKQVVDTDPPGVSISVPDAAQNSAFDATITFTEAVSGFEQTELTLSGTATASITAWAANSDNTVYTATITPTTSGTVVLNIAASVATDAANNPNTIATAQTVTVDLDAPAVSIGGPGNVQNGAFSVLITFTEAVSGFLQSEVSFTSNTAEASITAWDVSADETTYTATITPTTNGTVAIGIPASVAVDGAGNPNTASNTHSVTVMLIFQAVQVGPFAPSAMGDIAGLLDRAVLESLDPEMIAAQLSSLRSKSDGSLKYQRAIALLESMLAALRPVETLLLANYPNPFNPETWIPYHLSNPSEVVITIYDARGTIVRRLELGHQREGYYTSRSRAAYWDGRNHTGERVASGIYFYQLQADNMSLLRKMVILQ